MEDHMEPMTETPPEQPTIPDVLEEPLTGPETIVEDESTTIPTEPAQPPMQPALIPMTEDELREAGNTLAALVRELADMKADHAADVKNMREDREALQKRIESIALTIRQQGR
jgi:FtsZ-binding cell division protein ZapB